MTRRSLFLAVGTFLVATVALAATIAVGNTPFLGLDLQGGISVVLQPTEEVEEERIDEAIEIMRLRVDSLGVREPEITRSGQNILVQIPGVDDPERALELVGSTAELRFRPVLRAETEGAFDQIDPEVLEQLQGQAPGDPGAGPPVPATDDTTPTDDTGAGGEPTPGDAEEQSLGSPAVALASYAPTQVEPPDSDGAPPTTAGTGETTLPPLPPTTLPPAPDTTPPISTGSLFDQPLTTAEEDLPEATVILEGEGPEGETVRYQLGPTAITGDALNGARATLSGPAGSTWAVVPDFKSGSPGLDDLNAVAAQCYAGQPTCPGQPGSLAIVLDRDVVSAPRIQAPSYDQGIEITGSFSQGEAEDLATVLQYGALPLELEPEAVTSVSATIGEDALRAGVIAGIVGLGLAALYMIAFYRLLGVVAIASLAISAALLWTIVAYLGENAGLTLTLAGVTGIIVSIGVSLDSNVVYFEHLKEDMRAGRTLRSSVERSFTSAFSTIVKADLASLIGAVLLYVLTIGSVRGFALFLGLATVLDLIVSWLFMRPAVIWLGRSKFGRRPHLLGLPAERTRARTLGTS